MQQTKQGYHWQLKDEHACIHFNAMASPCELLVDTLEPELVERLAKLAYEETKRIEHKFSRYVADNIVAEINSSRGQVVEIDQEVFQLLTFAEQCYRLSEHLFDITSGVLRKAWHFDCSDNLPNQQQVESCMQYVGWDKVKFEHNSIRLQPDMQLDFGGIGKEYAVSRVAQLCLAHAPNNSVLVNFGGDIQVSQAKKNGQAWHVGIEDPVTGKAEQVLQLTSGALATSGDTNKYLLKDGVRYSHILNPQTGWPVVNAPRSVTVLASHCIQAGCLATIGLLYGADCEDFLQAQQVKFWCSR